MKEQEEKYLYDLSIILPTLGRIREVDAMLKSIQEYVAPTPFSFEIIVVDQNFSDLLNEIVEKYRVAGFNIIHHKVSFRGLSKAKNYGAKLAKGKFICFIDDDAEFLNGSVDIAIEDLNKKGIEAVSGRCIDRDGNDSVIRFGNTATILSLKDFEGKFIESTMFFKTSMFSEYSYDEEMGVGCFYGAEEGYDLVYRLLKDKKTIIFNPHIKFYHPQTVISRDSKASIRRAFTYRCGFGHLCRKHAFYKKYYVRVIKLVAYLLFLPFYKPKNFKYYLADLLGSIVGYHL